MSLADPVPTSRHPSPRTSRLVDLAVLVAVAAAVRAVMPSQEWLIGHLDELIPEPLLIGWLSLMPVWCLMHIPLMLGAIAVQFWVYSGREKPVSFWPSASAHVGGCVMWADPFVGPLAGVLLGSAVVGAADAVRSGRPHEAAVWLINGVSAGSLLNAALLMEASKGC